MVRSLLRRLASGPLSRQLRRFTLVGAFTAGIQMTLLWILVDTVGINYLIGAVIAIETTIICSYVLNNAWTFRGSRKTGGREYLAGLLKTNTVRGTAIPIQVGVLFVLVEWPNIPYLPANGIAILVSGLYRYALDAKWTWR